MSRGELFATHLGTFNRVLHEALPAFEVFAIEETDEALLVLVGSFEPSLSLVTLPQAEHGHDGRERLARLGAVIFGMSRENRPDGLSGGIGRLFVLELRSGERQRLVSPRLSHQLQGSVALAHVVGLLDDVTQIDDLILGSEVPARFTSERHGKEQENWYDMFEFHSLKL